MTKTPAQIKQHDEREAAWAAANKAESDHWENHAIRLLPCAGASGYSTAPALTCILGVVLGAAYSCLLGAAVLAFAVFLLRTSPLAKICGMVAALLLLVASLAGAAPPNCGGMVLTTFGQGLPGTLMPEYAVANQQLHITCGARSFYVTTDGEGKFACRPGPDGSSGVRIRAYAPDGRCIMDEVLAMDLPVDCLRLRLSQ